MPRTDSPFGEQFATWPTTGSSADSYYYNSTIVQIHANPTNIFVLVLVLVLDYPVFDYENEDDDEDDVVAA